MNCRRHGSKPTIALWMLVALADVAILAAAGGLLTVLLTVAGLVILAAAGVWQWQRQSRRPSRVVVRRRA
jgi:Flp pilus assembly protein TadB